jgi:NhaP-type Na+/H+ or K+/H+ antiporter
VNEQYLIGLAAILVVGIAARWIAWRLHLPSILLLLGCGLVAGPITGWLDPDALFGPVLMPMVSLSVGVILFEGGLSLNIRELRQIGVVTRLVTVGVLVTWVLATLGAYLILRLDLPMSLLIGAILVVSGPTVVIPLLEYVRPKGQVSTIIRWEGILNDPVGALLAVVVYEAILAGNLALQAEETGVQYLASLGVGIVVGLIGAVVMLVFFRYYLLPDYLQNPFSLSLVVAVFTVSNHFQPESGLLATTITGVALANQRWVDLRHIVEFKETLRVLVISSLFILLAARLRVSDFDQIDWRVLAFFAVLVFIARPAAVWVSAVGSDLNPQEREFISWIAPRGIVAAAVSSIFAERLAAAGVPGAEKLVPTVFFVIIGTVALYGLTAFKVAKRLGLAEPEPQGVLFVGAHAWARELAKCLQQEGIEVALADSNHYNVRQARMAGLSTHFGTILSEHVLQGVNLYGLGRLVALTSNGEANSLATLHFAGIFGRKEVYQLTPAGGREAVRSTVSPLYLTGRFLFDETATESFITKRFNEGAKLKRSPITERFTWKDWQDKYGESALPMFVITKEKKVTVATADRKVKAREGETVIALVTVPPDDATTVSRPVFDG